MSLKVKLLLSFTFIFRLIVSKSIEDKHLSPFSTFVQCSQQFVDCLQINFNQSTSLVDFSDGSHCIRNNLNNWILCHQLNYNTNHWIRVTEQVIQQTDKVLFLDQSRIYVMKFGHTNGSRFSNIRILIFHAFTQRFTQVFGDFIHTNTSHCTDGKSTNQRIGIFTVLNSKMFNKDFYWWNTCLDKRVHSHNCQIRLTFGVVHQIQID